MTQAGSCVSDIRACESCMLHPQPGLESHTASLLYAGPSVAHSKQSHRLTDWFLCVYASSARGQLDSTPGSSSSGSGSSPSWQLQLSNSYLHGLQPLLAALQHGESSAPRAPTLKYISNLPKAAGCQEQSASDTLAGATATSLSLPSSREVQFSLALPEAADGVKVRGAEQPRWPTQAT